MRADRRGLWQAGAALALLAGSSRLGTVRAGAPDGKTAETGLLAFRMMPLGGSPGGAPDRAGTPQGQVSFVLPSSHAPDPRLPRLPVERLLAGVRLVLTESGYAPGEEAGDELFRPEGDWPALAALSPAEWAALRRNAACRGLEEGVARLRPILLLSVAREACPAPGAGRAGRSPEDWLSGAARAMGLRTGALESVGESMAAADAVPEAVYLGALRRALADPASVAAEDRALQRAYEDGDLNEVRRLTVAAMGGNEAGRAAFDRIVISARSRRMAARLAEAATALPVVAVVGAAHLAGSDGMLALLQAQGFRLEAFRMRLAPG